MIYVILGFLMMRQMTKYDIKTVLSKEISPFYASSYGSINASIKKLLQLGYIDFAETIENGRHKKIYSILKEGEDAFSRWLKEDIVVDKARDELATKLFFYGFLPLDIRLKKLENYYEIQKEIHSGYTSFYNEVSKISYPAEHVDIATYQIMTLDYAKEHQACELIWLQKTITQLKEELNEHK